MDSELLSLKVQGRRSTHEFHVTCHMIAVTCIGCFNIQIVCQEQLSQTVPGKASVVMGSTA